MSFSPVSVPVLTSTGSTFVRSMIHPQGLIFGFNPLRYE